MSNMVIRGRTAGMKDAMMASLVEEEFCQSARRQACMIRSRCILDPTPRFLGKPT